MRTITFFFFLSLPVFTLAQSTMPSRSRTVIYHDNKITYPAPKMDTIRVTDPVTGKDEMKVIQTDPLPGMLNGRKIHHDEGVPPQYYIDDGSLEDRVMKGIAADLKGLKDGEYGLVLNDIVVNDSGRLVYYKFSGVEIQGFGSFGVLVDTNKIKGLNARIEQLMTTAPLMRPATVKGKPVPALLPAGFRETVITVRDHRVAYYRN